MSTGKNVVNGVEGVQAVHSSVSPHQFDFSSEVENAIKLRKDRVKVIRKLQELRQSTVFVLWTLEDLKPRDFFVLADMLEEEAPSNDIDLVILSHGGSGDVGYRIAHTLQGWAKRKQTSFRVIIPLYAKSAATIICLGADEIVMGLLSEIGPIDPQISRYDRSRQKWTYIPAMAVLDGLHLVSEYIQKLPQMSRFFEEIVRNEGLSLVDLGLLERMRESGKQYAETLLAGGMQLDKKHARVISERLTDYYKYHGHPIDAFEGERDLKLKIKHCEGDEWKAVKTIRDAYQSFVGQPSIIPGTVVTCAIETANFRSWRYMLMEEGHQRSRIMTEMIEGIHLESK